MKKRVEEQTLRTIALAALGLIALLVVLPDWARGGVLFFAAVYAVLVLLVDGDVRRVLDSRPRGNDTTKSPAKSPAASRAAT